MITVTFFGTDCRTAFAARARSLSSRRPRNGGMSFRSTGMETSTSQNWIIELIIHFRPAPQEGACAIARVPNPSSRFDQNVLLALQDLHDRRALEHAVFPCRIGGKFLHRKLAACPPAVEHEPVAINDRILLAHHPVFAFEQGIDFLEVGPEGFVSHVLHRGYPVPPRAEEGIR